MQAASVTLLKKTPTPCDFFRKPILNILMKSLLSAKQKVNNKKSNFKIEANAWSYHIGKYMNNFLKNNFLKSASLVAWELVRGKHLRYISKILR